MTEEKSNYHELCERFEEFGAAAGLEYDTFSNTVDRGSLVLRVLMNEDPSIRQLVENVEAPSGYLRGFAYLRELLSLPLKQLPRYELMFSLLLRNSPTHEDLPALQSVHTVFSQLVLSIDEKRAEEEEKFHRQYLQSHGTKEVLGKHKLAPSQLRSVKYCAQCHKSIWGLMQKGLLCERCENYYHPHCQAAVEGEQSCAYQAHLDLNKKHLLFSDVVYLLPDAAATLMAEREQGLKGKPASPRKDSSAARLPVASPQPSSSSPALRRDPTQSPSAPGPSALASLPSSKPPGKVFGVLLDEVIARDGKPPAFLQALCFHLRNNGGILEQGIFRLAGSQTAIDEWRAKFDANPALKFTPEEMTPHDATGVLKAYFQELPIPLFPYSLYSDLKAIDLASDDADVDSQMIYCVSHLSPGAYDVLTMMVRLCVAIVQHKEANKMGPAAIATAIAPGLIRPPVPDTDIASYSATLQKINALFQRMIERAADYFDERRRPKFTSGYLVWNSGPSSTVELRGLLMAFAEGLAIGHQWRYQNVMEPHIDVVGEVPWRSCSFVNIGEEKGMHKFRILASGQAWTFYLNSEAEVTDLHEKLKLVQEAAVLKRSLPGKEGSETDMRMSLMMKSDRYRTERLDSKFVIRVPDGKKK